MNPYSKEKMAWWLVKDGGLPPEPKQVQLIISDLCNQNCNFCAYRMDGYSSNQLFTAGAELAGYGHNNPKRLMPTDKAFEILDDCMEMGVQGIQFTGGGEPTVHPEHTGIFRRALTNGFACALVSNGLHWGDELRHVLLPKFSWVRVSVDAGTEATYRRIRQAGPGAWGRVWAHIQGLAARITSAGAPTVLGVGFVITPDNWQEVEQAVAMAKEAGANNIRLSAWFNKADAAPYAGIYQEIVGRVRQCKADADGEGFTVIEQFSDRMQDLFEGAPDYELCAYQHYNTYIGGDLNVYRCCVLAYNQRGLLGSLKDERFKAAWEGAAKDKRDNFDARGCERCQFNDKNRVMNYLLGARPLHVEFP